MLLAASAAPTTARQGMAGSRLTGRSLTVAPVQRRHISRARQPVRASAIDLLVSQPSGTGVMIQAASALAWAAVLGFGANLFLKQQVTFLCACGGSTGAGGRARQQAPRAGAQRKRRRQRKRVGGVCTAPYLASAHSCLSSFLPFAERA